MCKRDLQRFGEIRRESKEREREREIGKPERVD